MYLDSSGTFLTSRNLVPMVLSFPSPRATGDGKERIIRTRLNVALMMTDVHRNVLRKRNKACAVTEISSGVFAFAASSLKSVVAVA